MKRTLAVIGVPSSAGARRVGQELAPQWLRQAGLVDRLRATGAQVIDRGDLPQVTFSPDVLNPKQQNLPLVVGVLRQVARLVDDAVRQGTMPIVLGGDCTISLGVLAGLARHFSSLGMIYFDGDLDLNTPETTVSGILDGMVLAHGLGEGIEELSHLGPRHPLLREKDVILFGYSLEAGGIDPPEIERLERSAMAMYPVGSVNQGAAREALRDLESRVDHIFVHFDVDVLDFRDFPAADVPHQPGLTLAAAQDALQVFLSSPKVAGLALTEFNAKRDGDAKLAGRLIKTLALAIP